MSKVNLFLKGSIQSNLVLADKAMQLNRALFMLGGGSGYVLQPDVMRDDAFDPFEKDSLSVEPIIIQLQVGLVLTAAPLPVADAAL